MELYWVDTFTAREPGEEYRLVKQTTKPLRNTSDTTVSVL